MDLLRARKPSPTAYISLPIDDEETSDEKHFGSKRQHPSIFKVVLLSSFLTFASFSLFLATFIGRSSWPFPSPAPPLPSHIVKGLEACKGHSFIPGPSKDFADRTSSDRFVAGTKKVVIFNATLWTGNDEGNEVFKNSSLILDGGIIKYVGSGEGKTFNELTVGGDFELIDAQGLWVTPGVVDLHSHVGVYGVPFAQGASDGNSFKGNTNPYLRALDGFNTHDASFRLITSGGTTTSLVLPGSADAIGGQGFLFKLRPTDEATPSSMLLEPPFIVAPNGTWIRTNHARHTKHAFGENPSRVWGGTRMDTQWDFRSIYEEARLVKVAQDEWCSAAEEGSIEGLAKYPASPLRLEILVETLRGQVLVNAHCYEATDLDALGRLSNEFQFHVAAVHHAHEAHLVPSRLKTFFGGPPAAAIFAWFGRYKHEAWRHSVFAPKILHDAGIKVIMKSDDAGRSRYLTDDAVSAHYYGLEANIALSSVISTPAEILGKGHRIGYLRKGYDADVVIWQSHPLQLGATPSQVFVDGIPQLSSPHLVPRSALDQEIPPSADYREEIQEVIDTHGDPSFEPKKRVDTVVFTNVSSVILRDGGKLKELLGGARSASERENDVVVVSNGAIVCVGSCVRSSGQPVVDLKGGSIQPGLTTFGTSLGLADIAQESSTTDTGADTSVPGALSTGAIIQASDGLAFAGKEVLVSLRAGVTKSITIPTPNDLFVKGYNTFFSLAAPHRLAPGAILAERAGLTLNIGHTGTPVSLQIALLRELLQGKANGTKTTPLEDAFASILAGESPLVINVDSADQIATILQLKAEVEAKPDASKLRIVLTGAAEGHLLVHEIAAANVGVIVFPRSNPNSWDQRRVLPGVPLSEDSTFSALYKAGVTVAIGGPQGESADVSTTRWKLAFLLSDSKNSFTTLDVLAFATTNLEQLLGLTVPNEGKQDWIAVEHGSILGVGRSKVVAVGTGDGEKGEVLLF